MCLSDPPSELRHSLPKLPGVLPADSPRDCPQLKLTASLSQVSSSWDSLHPVTGHCGMQRPSPAISVLDISEESPQLRSPLGFFGTVSQVSFPLTLPNPASFTSFPRKYLHRNLLYRAFQGNLTFDVLSSGFLSSGDLDLELQCPSSKGLVEGLGSSTLLIIIEMQVGLLKLTSAVYLTVLQKTNKVSSPRQTILMSKVRDDSKLEKD